MTTIHKVTRLSGGRLTKIKKAIVNILSEDRCLLSKTELVKKLKIKNICPDRSTIYRELLLLTKNSVIIKNTIFGVDYYEIPEDHHHHLVCIGCNSINKVGIGNHLVNQEKIIAEKNKFEIINHSLEFYGYCVHCKS
jgi:Fe2+ or Zn2+ uptake regulation protein